MKTQKNLIIRHFKAIISLLSMLIATQTMSMIQSPAQKRLVAAKLATIRKIMPALKKIPSFIWVQTNDDEITALAPWKVDQMGDLKSLLAYQKDKTSRDNPIKVQMLTKAELTLLSTALDKMAAGEFDEYYQSLEPEYKQSLTDKNIGLGQLRMLITAAGKIKSTTLTALLSSYFLPNDMQKYLMIPQIITPVTEYLKDKLTQENKLTPTILTGHSGAITNCNFNKDGSILATSAQGAYDNIIIWNAYTGEKLKTITVADEKIELIEISPDGSKIISSYDKKIDTSKGEDEPNNTKATLILWDSKTGNQIKTLDLDENIVANVEFSYDGKRIVFGSQQNEIIVDGNNDQEEKTFISIADGNTGKTIVKHEITNNYPFPILNPNGNTMTIYSENNLLLYDLITGNMIKKLEGPTENIYTTYTKDGTKIIAVDTPNNTIFIWDAITGNLLAQFNNINNNMHSALNFNGTKLLTTEVDSNKISMWDVITQTKIHSIENPLAVTYSLVFSPDDTMILAAGEGSPNILIWDANTGEQIHAFTATPDSIDATFSSNGKRIQSHRGTEENQEKCTVILWDTSTARPIHTFVAQHELLAMDRNFLTIASPDDTNNQNFILWTSLTPTERSTLKTIEKDLNLNQVHLLYQLYIAQLSKTPLSLTNNKQFSTLPNNVQNIVNKYLITRKPTEDLAAAFEQEPEVKPVPKPTAEPVILEPQPIQRQIQPIAVQPLPQPTQPAPAKTWWQWFTGQ